MSTITVILIVIIAALIAAVVTISIEYHVEHTMCEYWFEEYLNRYHGKRNEFKQKAFDELTKGVYNPEQVPELLEKRMEMYDQIFGHKKGGIVSSKGDAVFTEIEYKKLLEACKKPSVNKDDVPEINI